MKKINLILSIVLTFTLILNTTSSAIPESLKIKANVYSKGCIVIEDNVDSIMYEKNKQSKFYPASTLKILTALVALENGNIKSKVIVGKNIRKLPSDSSVAEINPGDVLTLEQLLYGMLLCSGNDCALAIAEHIGKSESNFVKLMNKKAKSLGALNSHFVNSHGYHANNQYTTPYDLALIAQAAAKDPVFRKIIHTSSYKAVYKNQRSKTITNVWKTTNKFLKTGSGYSLTGIIGSKTGYTTESGYNLVTFTSYRGHSYISVMLKSGNNERFRDTISVIQKAYTLRKNFLPTKSPIPPITPTPATTISPTNVIHSDSPATTVTPTPVITSETPVSNLSPTPIVTSESSDPTPIDTK